MATKKTKSIIRALGSMGSAITKSLVKSNYRLLLSANHGTMGYLTRQAVAAIGIFGLFSIIMIKFHSANGFL
jgi:hypothetical protein